MWPFSLLKKETVVHHIDGHEVVEFHDRDPEGLADDWGWRCRRCGTKTYGSKTKFENKHCHQCNCEFCNR